jgi:hypothetical protein
LKSFGKSFTSPNKLILLVSKALFNISRF